MLPSSPPKPRKKPRKVSDDPQKAFLRAVQALERIAKAQSKAYQAQAQALTQQMQLMTRYLDLFSVTEAPTARVMRDEDEWKAEQDRLFASKGFPSGASAPEQLRYTLMGMD